MKAFCGPALAFSWVLFYIMSRGKSDYGYFGFALEMLNRLRAALLGSLVVANSFGSFRTERLRFPGREAARGCSSRRELGGPRGAQRLPGSHPRMHPLPGLLGFWVGYFLSQISPLS